MIQENQKILNNINIVTDIIIMFLSLILSYMIRFYILSVSGGFIKLDDYLEFLILSIPLQVFINLLSGLYQPMRTKRYYQQAIIILRANTIFLGIVLVILYIAKLINFSNLVFIYFYFIYTFVALVKRYILHKSLHRMRSMAMNLKNIIVIGSGDIAKEYIETISTSKSYGFHYFGHVADKTDMEGRYLGNFSQLYDILQKNKTADVVAALDLDDIKELENIVNVCEQTGSKLSIVPFYYHFISSKPYIDQVENIPLLNIRRIPLDNIVNAALKRGMDICGSLFLLLLFSPVMLFAAVGIKLTSPGPVIFKQKRVGREKKTFVMYKFRSMRINDKESTGWSTNSDPRKTKFGAFIRKLSIDEMPQFFNVLKGDMSLVGPRPEVPHYVYDFQKKIPLYMVKHQVKPGITGWAQVHGYRGDTSIRKRIEHDVYYIENWNLILDIYILVKTMLNGFINAESLN